MGSRHSYPVGFTLAPDELPCPVQGFGSYVQSSILLTHVLCLADGALLCVLPVEESWKKTTRERAFSVIVPRPWNGLVWDACLATLLVSFRCQVKIEKFRWALKL